MHTTDEKKYNFDFRELDKLEEYLKGKGIPYKRKEILDGEIIVVYKDGKAIWDATLHTGSFGHKRNLLEAMGAPLLGYDHESEPMTADEIISLIENK